jgi:flagellar biosynthesis/type III secretory pathway ATPase
MELKGRVLNGLGEPLDDKGRIKSGEQLPGYEPASQSSEEKTNQRNLPVG